MNRSRREHLIRIATLLIAALTTLSVLLGYVWNREALATTTNNGVVSDPADQPGSAFSHSKPDLANRMRISEVYGKTPLSFEANRGQTYSQVKYISRGKGYSLFLTSTGAIFSLQKDKTTNDSLDATHPSFADHRSSPEPAAVMRMRFVGANPKAKVTGSDELPGKVNYFIGNDPKKWRTNISTYAKVEYRGIYPGVDLIYHGAQRQLEYDLIVAPGADYRKIKLGFEGVDKMEINADGDLILRVGGEEILQRRPVIYQEVNGARREISGGYALRGKRQAGFRVGNYDHRRPLVIDPVLSFSTYLGGSSFEFSRDIAVDSAGNAYVTGRTSSPDFPTTLGAFGVTNNGSADVFVTKLNSGGSALVYSTYLGGADLDQGNGITVDSAGSAYLTGFTWSSNFPTTPGAFDSTFNTIINGADSPDAFVAKLNSAGSALDYSTYLGALGLDEGLDIAVDSAGAAYVSGATESPVFPMTPGVFDSTHNGGPDDAFVTKLNSAGSALVYSTYLGGADSDRGDDIALDSAGNAYVLGRTGSLVFPTTPGAFDTTHHGSFDVFVAKLDPAASGAASLVYSTYIGGNDADEGHRIAVDALGAVYVVGRTASTDFPTSLGALQTVFGGVRDVFVTKLDPAVSGMASLVYSTYLGGSDNDEGEGIAVDASGNAFITGTTRSTDFPTTSGAFQTAHNGLEKVFVVKIAENNTPAGGNVTIQPVDLTTMTAPVTLTFSNVVQGGNTTLTTSDTGPSPPPNFQLGAPPTYYDLRTTAVYSGGIQVCIDYTGVSYPDEAGLRLFHFESGGWVDVTTSLDTGADVICGNVTSLSPFAIFQRVNPPQTMVHLRGTGPSSNPPTLFLDTAAPGATTAKFKDSPAINFNGGNLWKEVGVWPAAPSLIAGSLTALSDLRVWLGLKNSDDQGANFDLRIEVSRNGALVAASETYCIRGVTRNPNMAKEAVVSFAPFSPVTFNGATDEMSLKVLTRIGSDGAGGFCGGHSNAVGLRLYFDSVSRPSRFNATIAP
ncbi:MAG: SBBP repeat-containing protein [Acidobacteria bacterium]|nr:SBBP repeat-containing protein [Acidobacteriota bacterium]